MTDEQSGASKGPPIGQAVPPTDDALPSPGDVAPPSNPATGPARRPRPLDASASPATIVGTVPLSLRTSDVQVAPPTVVGTIPPNAQDAWLSLAAHADTAYPDTLQAELPNATVLPYGRQYGSPTGVWQNARAFVQFHLSRAISRDLRAVEVSPAEEPILASHGVRDHTIRQYLLWRRSWLYLLLPLALVAATIQIIGFVTTEIDTSSMSWFGVIMLGGTLILQMVGYPIAASIAVWKWEWLAFSRWTLVAGLFVSYLLPFAVALVPFGHYIVIEETDPQIIQGQRLGAGIAGAMFWLVWLLPALLAIMPGILRASVRIKSLLPESIVPGWIIVMTAPFFTLVLLLVFVVVNQIAGNLLLVCGVLLLMASPVVFLIRTDLLIKPVTEFRERRHLDQMQVVYVVVLAIGSALLMTYAFTFEILGRPLVGDTENPEAPALVTVGRFGWEICQFMITYAAKSVFVTAVAIDLFMLLNLSVWKNLKAFEGTPHAQEYDRIMSAFRDLAEGKDDPSRPFASPPGSGFEIRRGG